MKKNAFQVSLKDDAALQYYLGRIFIAEAAAKVTKQSD